MDLVSVMTAVGTAFLPILQGLRTVFPGRARRELRLMNDELDLLDRLPESMTKRPALAAEIDRQLGVFVEHQSRDRWNVNLALGAAGSLLVSLISVSLVRVSEPAGWALYLGVFNTGAYLILGFSTLWKALPEHERERFRASWRRSGPPPTPSGTGA